MPKGFKFARYSTSVGMITVQKGQAIRADDPLVAQHPDLWDDEPTAVVSSIPRSYGAPVERATAAPGEKRL
jgi:hypothetical protein